MAGSGKFEEEVAAVAGCGDFGEEGAAVEVCAKLAGHGRREEQSEDGGRGEGDKVSAGGTETT